MNRFLNTVLAFIVGAGYSTFIAVLFVAAIGSMVKSGANPIAILFVMLVMAVYVVAALLSIRASYCATCRRYFLLKRSFRTLVEPTYQTKGKQQVTCHCSRCSYRRVYEEEMPVLREFDAP